MVHELRVIGRGSDPMGAELLGEIRRLNLGSFEDVRTVKVYRFEGLEMGEVEKLAWKIVESGQGFQLDEPVATNARRVVEVGYKPGVMNPEAASLMKVARDLGFSGIIAA